MKTYKYGNFAIMYDFNLKQKVNIIYNGPTDINRIGRDKKRIIINMLFNAVINYYELYNIL